MPFLNIQWSPESSVQTSHRVIALLGDRQFPDQVFLI